MYCSSRKVLRIRREREASMVAEKDLHFLRALYGWSIFDLAHSHVKYLSC